MAIVVFAFKHRTVDQGSRCKGDDEYNAIPDTLMIEADFLFGLAEASFKRDTSDSPKRPANPTRYAIGSKVFHFTAENVASDDQCALVADESRRLGLAPACVPPDLPHLSTTRTITRFVLLCVLLRKACRVLGEVCYFAGLGIAAGQTRILFGACLRMMWRFSQDFWLRQPNVGVRWNFNDEGLHSLIQPVQKSNIAIVQFVGSPGVDFDSVYNRRSIKPNAICGFVLRLLR